MPKVTRWDSYFFRICGVVASNSRCLSRKIGAVIAKNNRVLATGYNGPAAGVGHCDERFRKDSTIIEQLRVKGIMTPEHPVCPRRFLGFESGEGKKYCVAGHAEQNCITNAARYGTCLDGATMYVGCPIPCSSCLNAIINAGIVEVVCTHFEVYDVPSFWILKTAPLKVRNYEGLLYSSDGALLYNETKDGNDA